MKLKKPSLTRLLYFLVVRWHRSQQQLDRYEKAKGCVICGEKGCSRKIHHLSA